MGQAAQYLLLRVRALRIELPGPPHEGHDPQLEHAEKPVQVQRTVDRTKK